MAEESIKKENLLHKVSGFRKRSLNWKSMGKYLCNIILNIKQTIQFSGLNKELTERIMLAVTSVNNCRYCTYFHTKVALESGCTQEEIRELLDGDLSCADQEELPALMFAQHFAESHEQPSRKALKQLVKVYGVKKTQQIITACRMITLGNLFGNTIDAYAYRYHGIVLKGGSSTLEGLIYYLSAIPAQKLMKTFQRDRSLT
ncbi:MAG: carboxymuconolactone decarboxylase family protein [Candidatus Lokiarchaeota archaeon]|nr:carboxymuconolactone decarboxylase family protein [Candidatus Lokiarchaeota archaeon]